MSDLPVTRYDNTLILIIKCEGDSHDILQELQYLSDPVVIVSNMQFVTGFAKPTVMSQELKSIATGLISQTAFFTNAAKPQRFTFNNSNWYFSRYKM